MSSARAIFIYRVLVVSVSIGFIAGAVLADGPVR